jgi:PAT family beta-lactamase induction signal transducer AmpG
MAGLMGAAAVLSAHLLPRVATPPGPRPAARQDLLGFAAVLAAVARACCSPTASRPARRRAAGPLAGRHHAGLRLQQRWVDLRRCCWALPVTLPLAAWAARRARFDTLLAACATTSPAGRGGHPGADRALQAGRRLCRQRC